MAKKATYGNESIKSLRGADRVRKRPAVIFGSDGLEGCEHSIFEIMSNSIDEAREGRGNRIVVTRYLDGSYEVQDFGSGIPVDYNKNEQRENWELLFCEMYAGSKYDNAGGAGSIPEGTADADRIVVTQIPPDFTDDHRHGIGGETDV